jgi:hypothetical protein
LIRSEAQDSKDKVIVTASYLAEVEKTKFRARKEDNEELAVHLKAFVRMTVTAEK